MLVSCCFVFFFFKQKTAYEMRVSDWSSDVCSSDLEEVLRYNPPVQIIFRHTTVDTEIAGVKIPAGSAVMPILASANRDESKFEDPETFDIDRKIEFPLMSFGQGPHFCLGNYLSRMEAREIGRAHV